MSLVTELEPSKELVESPFSTTNSGKQKQNKTPAPPLKFDSRPFLTVIAAIVLACAGAECLARMLACMTVPADGKDRAFDAKMQLANKIANDKDPAFIFIGNSITNQGVYADLIQERLKQRGFNLKVLNLGTTGSCMQEKLHLLDAACGPNAGPRSLVFQVSPAEFEEELALISDPSEEFFASYVGRNSKYRPASKQRSFWDKAFDTLDQYSYLSRYRKYWCQNLHYAFGYITNPEAFRSRGPLPSVHSQCSLKGWSPWYGFASDADLDMYTQTGLREFHARTGKLPAQEWKWDFSRIQMLSDYCKKHNLPLTLMWMPELSDKTFLYNVKHSTPEKCLERMVPWTKSNGAELLDLHKSDSEPTHFSTWNHHNALGALHNSETIADWITTTKFANRYGKARTQK